MFISNEDTYSNDIFIEIIKFIKRYNKFNVDTDIYINKLDLLPDIYKNKDEYRTLYNIIQDNIIRHNTNNTLLR